MTERQESERQKKALQKAQRILKSMDPQKYWEEVLSEVAPQAEANERIRAKSFAKAAHHVLR